MRRHPLSICLPSQEGLRQLSHYKRSNDFSLAQSLFAVLQLANINFHQEEMHTIQCLNRQLQSIPVLKSDVLEAAHGGEFPVAKLFARIFQGLIHWNDEKQQWLAAEDQLVSADVLVTLFINKVWPTVEDSDKRQRKQLETYLGSYYRVSNALLLAKGLLSFAENSP